MIENGAENGVESVAGVCPRCGALVPVSGRGRPRVWCTQVCRRAAYEVRRAAREGERPVQVVQVRAVPVVGMEEHVQAVLSSPAACRRVVYELGRKARDGVLDDPRWSGVGQAFMNTAVVFCRR